MRTSPIYGESNPNRPNFYPVNFCQRTVPSKGNIYKDSCDASAKELNDNPGFACHGAELDPARGLRFSTKAKPNKFGTAVGEAYGAFYRDGVIPKGEDYSLNTLAENDFREMNFLKEDKPDKGRPGVAFPWTENQNAETVRKYADGCAALDAVHKAHSLYTKQLNWDPEKWTWQTQGVDP